MYSIVLEFLSSSGSSLTSPIGGLSIFPNPIADFINIEFIASFSNQGYIEIYDSQGNLLYTVEKQFIIGLNKFTLNNTLINKNNFPPGIYFLKIKGGSASSAKKFSLI
jgi:flagellar hook assembly protein FlgD